MAAALIPTHRFSTRRICSLERKIESRDWLAKSQTFLLTNHITKFLFSREQIRPVENKITLHNIKFLVRQKTFLLRDGGRLSYNIMDVCPQSSLSDPRPLLTIDNRGHLETGMISGIAGILLTSREDFGVNQTVVVHVEVSILQ